MGKDHQNIEILIHMEICVLIRSMLKIHPKGVLIFNKKDKGYWKRTKKIITNEKNGRETEKAEFFLPTSKWLRC